ncbi:MAG TPA: hypothetical protein VIM65_02995 [Cyclobacteriaceae bacterium]
MEKGVGKIHEKIRLFQKKYYLNIFVRGTILTLSFVFGYFLLAALLENTLWLGHWARLLLFFTFFGIIGFCLFRFLKDPIRWWISKRGIGEEQSAQLIGNSIPSVKDRLLNLIQLSAISTSDLGNASIQQKAKEFEPLSFDSVIDISANRRYLKFLIIPVGIIGLILIINQSILTSSTNRIIHFNQQYSPQAPFTFSITDKSLSAFYNEDFLLELQLIGEVLPENVYILSDQTRLKMDHQGNGKFTYTFENIRNNVDLQFEAAGFYSDSYEINVFNRPELSKFNIELSYPKYLQRKNDELNNVGNLQIPEGTVVIWNVNATNTVKAELHFKSNNQTLDFQNVDNQTFTFKKQFKDPDQYEIILANDKSINKEKILYQVDVIKDEYPKITVNNFKDSILYQRVILSGAIGDDYGTTDLALHFKIKDEKQKDVLTKTIKIDIIKNQLQQNFFFNWSLDSIKLKAGEQLEYYLQVWDNDGVNGRKSTRSSSYSFQMPTEDDLLTNINKSRTDTEQKIEQSASKATKLQDQIEQANQKLKGKQNLDWQDKKMLEDIIQQKQSLDQMVDQMKEQNKLLQDKKDVFTEQDKRIKEKSEQIQKLMNQVLDEETKKLFEELQKLLKENSDASQIQKLLDKLNQNTNNLEKELDRMLELFKQVEYETKLDLTIQKLKQQVEDQKSILEKTEDLSKDQSNSKQEKNNAENKSDKKDQLEDSKSDQSKNKGDNSKNDQNNQELAKEQQELKEDFQKTSEKIEELKKLGDELDKEDKLPTEEDSKEISQDQNDSQKSLEENNKSKAKQSQQKALKEMQQIQEQMEGMQNDMEMEMDMQNLEALRQVIHGLIKLSYNQESLMKSFSELQQSDPRFNTIAEQQLKLKDDAKVLEDSLLAIAKRDPFMGSVVTREISELNNHLEKVTEANRERKRPQASSEMQSSMTSINNLALMLDSHYDMMMQMMANAKPSMKPSKKKGQKPSLSQMQQQLNQKIEQLKNSGKSGRQLSEELAGVAAEQERIRRALQEMQDKMKNEGKTPGGDLPTKMEQTEMDLVNKQLTDQMIKRQKEILTRLLETEKSQREQDQDEERKGETAKDYEKEIPKAFEEYLRLKEKEVELLKSVPPKLLPYYKKEAGEYFKRVGNQ